MLFASYYSAMLQVRLQLPASAVLKLTEMAFLS